MSNSFGGFGGNYDQNHDSNGNFTLFDKDGIFRLPARVPPEVYGKPLTLPQKPNLGIDSSGMADILKKLMAAFQGVGYSGSLSDALKALMGGGKIFKPGSDPDGLGSGGSSSGLGGGGGGRLAQSGVDTLNTNPTSL